MGGAGLFLSEPPPRPDQELRSEILVGQTFWTGVRLPSSPPVPSSGISETKFRIFLCNKKAVRNAFNFLTAFLLPNHAGCFPAELLSRDNFLSSPWKKESSKERRRRQIEIFLRSVARTFVLETFYKHRASKTQTSLRSFARGIACGDILKMRPEAATN